jgi:hypothetical protein
MSVSKNATVPVGNANEPSSPMPTSDHGHAAEALAPVRLPAIIAAPADGCT